MQAIHGQSGSISGYVYNDNDSASIPGAHIIIDTGQKKYWAVSDNNGFFKIKPVEPGTYSALFSFSGLDSLKISNIKVTSDLDTYLKKIYMTSRNLPLVVIKFDYGLIDEDGGMITKVDALTMKKLPTRGDMKTVLSYMSTDYFVSERSQQVLFRGSREGASAYYIDGIRVEGMVLPGMGVGYMQVYSGGVPARFGDFTGGVVEVETKSYNDCVEERKSIDLYLKITEAPAIVTLPEPTESDPETENAENP